MNKDNEICVEKMFLHIGNLIRYLLNAVTEVYEQNHINYSVYDFHEKIMRMLAPPCELLRLNDEDSSQDWVYSDPPLKSGQSQPKKQTPQMLKIAETKEAYKPDLNLLGQIIEKKNDERKEKKKKIFIENPTGVAKDVRDYGNQKGYFFKKSLKVMKHIKKFTQNYQQNQARKNDPNKMPKRRLKTQQEKKADQQRLKSKMPMKRGRKLEDGQLEQKVSRWAKMQISKGKKLRKVDIRNIYHLLSGGKSKGSTGWCRRFLQRNVEIKSYFKKTKELTQTNRLAKTEQAKQKTQWLRPGQQGQLGLPSVKEELSQSQFLSQSFEEALSIEEYDKSTMKSGQQSHQSYSYLND